MTTKKSEEEGGWRFTYDCPNCATTYWTGIVGKHFCEVCGYELEIRDEKPSERDGGGPLQLRDNSQKKDS